ncbi:MAG TPA: sigma-70 family RNA polymerase sigma factor [Pyrinomonadaceae bacterium]|jgi:RNA polymerase sigma-70 factor (ECF subfamily)|nr:sigma-70 family RNA polymerase sigma factor [Pyrinomonadaceae bacterium]
MMKRLTVDELNLEGQPGAFAGTLMNSSADLVTRVCQGDSEAFRLIFERYSRPVISFIFDIVNDRGLAEELTQETFVRAYRAMRTMRRETKLSTWLFGIARNVARESIRARIRANSHVDLGDKAVMDLSDDKPVPVEGLLSKELNDVIRRSLAALDEDKRLVFTLKVLHQCSYEEIAAITGFSIAKLKTDLHRARAEMRRRVSPYAGVGYEV